MSADALDNVVNILSGPGERSSEELRHDIEAKKEAIAGTIKRLDKRVQRATDWRAQVGEHPILALGIAAGAGCMLAAILKPKPSPYERIMDALAESVEDITDQVGRRITSHLTRNLTGGLLKAAAATLLTKGATAYLRNKLNSTSKERTESVED